MIPRNLQIKNFLSYGSDGQVINFEPYQLICLSGKNGHGKSALLDAITWVIWGNARKIQNTAKADQGLLRLGQTSMSVIFECIIHATTYRIKREFELVYGKPKTSLEFGSVRPDGTVIPLTEKTLRDTQACIDRIIGLDYETFINSAFLRQGNANEFSKRSPKERKEIISTILGLGLYDILRRAALEKIKTAQTDVHTLQALITHTQAELIQYQTLLATAPTIAHQLDSCTNTQKQLQTQIVATHAQITSYTQAQQDALRMHQEIQTRLLKYQEQSTLLLKLHALWRSARSTARSQDDYTTLSTAHAAAHTAYSTVHMHATTYLEKKEILNRLEQEYAQVTHSYEKEQNRIQQELQITQERIGMERTRIDDMMQQYTQEHATYTLELEILTVRQTQNSLLRTQLHTTLSATATVQQRFDKRKEAYHRWTALGNMLRDQHALQLQRLALTNNIQDPSCPLCEQNLTAARRRFLHTKLQADTNKHLHTLTRLKFLLPRLKDQLVADHATLAKLQAAQIELQSLEHMHITTNDQIVSLQARQTFLQTELTTLQAQSGTLHKQATQLIALIRTPPLSPTMLELQNIQKQLRLDADRVAQEITTLPYKPESLAPLHAELQRLDAALRAYTQINQELERNATRKQEIIALIAHLKQEKSIIKAAPPYAQQATEHAHLISQLTTMYHTLTTQRTEVDHVRDQLMLEQGRLDAARITLTNLETQLTTHTDTINNLMIIINEYQAIATAAGKDGIQALLIEEAIPDIEQSANALLGTLTNNSTHIIIDSLRDLKSGGTRETLDIKISDAQGIRPYEMFSGGEAFRIDFALRVAISKLLAQRAGTALQTLIIDEGFGSQDDEGLSAMMDILHHMQHEFAKIIIVSHLPTMKDQFPVHFHIEKTPTGSTVQVLEQG